MDPDGGRPIQGVVKEVCSISYVSEKLQVSRPSLYKYMELYDSGDTSKIPDRVLAFFRFLTSAKRSEDDAILYFINEGSRRAGQEDVRTECLTGGGRAMITFPGSPTRQTRWSRSWWAGIPDSRSSASTGRNPA